MTILLYITGITVWTNHTEISPSDISKYFSTPYLLGERLGECKHVFSIYRLEITDNLNNCINILILADL